MKVSYKFKLNSVFSELLSSVGSCGCRQNCRLKLAMGRDFGVTAGFITESSLHWCVTVEWEGGELRVGELLAVVMGCV